MSPRRWVARLVALVRRQRLDRELDHEIAAHLELAERDARAEGLSPAAARDAARRRFGGVDQMKEVHRDGRSMRWLETLLKDLRHGVTLIGRDPGFSFVVIGVLALGIGANTAMFSLIDAVLLKPLPYSEPERIVRLWEAPRPDDTNGIATSNFLDWKRRATSFEALAAERGIRAAVQRGPEPARMIGRAVSADYFRVFGIDAQIGRTFAAGEDEPGATPVVVLSHAAWQVRFGGDRTLLNSDLLVDGQPHTVVGVLPPGSFDRGTTEFWKPLVITPDQYSRDYHALLAVGRLKAGVDLATARREMLQIGEETARVSPPEKKDWRVAVVAFDADLVGDTLRRSLYVTFGAVALVLLIACGNVANLLLAKGLSRNKEMAVRAALGAGQGRLVRQLLTEVTVLGVLGAVAGLALAYLILETVSPYVAAVLPPTATIALDGRTMAFAAVTTIVVAGAVGLLPALRTSFTTLTDAMREGGRGNSGGASEQLRRAIVSAEVALTLILICGAALMFKSLLALQRVDTGTRVENVIAASVDLPPVSYPTSEAAVQFYDVLAENVRAVPGVERVGIATAAPLQGTGQNTGMFVPGAEDRVGVGYKRVDAGYFSALDIPIVAGRGLSDQDRRGTPRVVVINETLASRLRQEYGFADPVGRVVQMKAFEYARDASEVVDWTIVGVMRDERVEELRSEVRPVAYVSLAQVPNRAIRLIVRTQGEPAAAMTAIRAAVQRVNAQVPLGGVQTLEQIRDRSLSGTRESAALVGTFAGVAGLLAAIGLYGVLAQIVAQRRREIGIRMALGAQSRDVLSMIVGNAAKILVAGLVVGVIGLVALSRVIESVLFEVSPLDPRVLATACVALSAIAIAAATIPARRASAVDPVTALRSDS